jgi:hypothetical protein
MARSMSLSGSEVASRESGQTPIGLKPRLRPTEKRKKEHPGYSEYKDVEVSGTVPIICLHQIDCRPDCIAQDAGDDKLEAL